MIKYIFILLLIIGCGDTARENGNSYTVTTDAIKLKPLFSFTNSKYSDKNGMEQLIIDDINSAKKSIKLAIYGFTNDDLRDALINAHNNGISVKIVTDDSEFEKQDITVIKQSGIEVISDQDSSSLMHNKFLIIDSDIVWTGSANYSYYAFYKNNENIIKITNTKVAKVYTDEFNELATHKKIEGAYISDELEIYFSPEDDFEQRLLQLIENSKESIDFLAFAFTSKKIAAVLKEKYDQGIKIRGVFDKKWHDSSRYSQYKSLLDYHIDVKLDGNKQTMHNKIFIIDEKIVVTGSYNFTAKANDDNSENSLVVHNKEFTNRYIKEFESIFAIGN
jgi:phosphatidylserine/phosphatidylglycerophosphate/cardiolipin synthase-like enzyme